MTDDSMAPTGDVGRHYCPTCEPITDPLTPDQVLTPRYCYEHEPDRSGPDDPPSETPAPRTGTGEAEGADCAAMQRVLDERDQS